MRDGEGVGTPEKPRRRARAARRPDTFEVDLEAGALYRNGRRVALQEQPFKVLVRLIVRPGEIVSREMLQAELWGNHPPIDKEQGLNAAIAKLRAAFRDSAELSRFVERVPRRGYRYIGPDLARTRSLTAARTVGAETDPRDVAADLGHTAVARGTSTEKQAPWRQTATGRRSRSLAWSCAGVLAVGLAAALAIHPSVGTNSHPHAAHRRRLKGLGGWDLIRPQDRAVAFDYDHSGKLDHLVVYRPGTPRVWVLRRDGDGVEPIYTGNDLTNYEPRSGADQVLAFDFEHSGKRDYLLVYRPGAGVLRIVRNDGAGIFTSVYRAGPARTGAAKASDDQAVPFDYDHSGKLDHLLLYRSGVGIVGVWTNRAGRWTALRPAEAEPADRKRGQLSWPVGQAFAFDFDHTGKLDHLVVFNPNTDGIVVFRNAGGAFARVFESQGVGGFDRPSANDKALATSYDRSGRLDHILVYRPGAGLATVLGHGPGTLSPVYSGSGLAGYDLRSPNDQVLPFDFDGSGKPDHLVLYRPGAGLARIARIP